MIEGVIQNDGSIPAALGKAGRAAEVETYVRDIDLRNADGAGIAVIDIDAIGIEIVYGRKHDVNAVETEAGFIHQGRRKDVALTEGKELAVGLTNVAKA